MKKMPGVESVEPRLNEGKAIVKLRPGNTVRFDDLIKVVRDKAFTPKEARVSAEGEVLSTGTKLQLKLRGTNEIYELTGTGAAELQKSTGKTLLVEGVIPAPKEKTYLKVIELKSARP